jgi:hypothetical protein
MTKRPALILPAVAVGLLFLAVAIVYFASSAHGLPGFFPGHVGASSKEAAHHHVKHGIAALVVAAACFVFAWFQTGTPSGPSSPRSRPA